MPIRQRASDAGIFDANEVDPLAHVFDRLKSMTKPLSNARLWPPALPPNSWPALSTRKNSFCSLGCRWANR